jgi:hypothetical protein
MPIIELFDIDTIPKATVVILFPLLKPEPPPED